MVYIILLIAFIIATYRWGDWRNWKLYHSTILYFLYGDLLYNYLASWHHPLWISLPNYPVDTYLVSLLLAQLIFVCTTLIYLGNYPENKLKAVWWIGFWLVLYAFIEVGLLKLGAMKYYNGWNFLYSTLFDIMMFPMLRLHFKRPILAYLLSVPITIVLLILTKMPLRV